MKKYIVPIGALLFILLAGCNSPLKVGGACNYVDVDEIAQLTEIRESVALLVNDLNTYEVELDSFSLAPTVGARYKVSVSKMIKGTCTPIIIKSVKLHHQQ